MSPQKENRGRVDESAFACRGETVDCGTDGLEDSVTVSIFNVADSAARGYSNDT